MKKTLQTLGILAVLAVPAMTALAQTHRPPVGSDGITGRCITSLSFYNRHTALCNSLGIWR